MSTYEVGRKVRDLRKNKGLTINEFAKELGVSAGYLSNLETEKTETISISLIETFEKRYHLSLFSKSDEVNAETNERVERVCKGLAILHDKNKEHADFLLKILEQGLKLFL